MLLKKKLKKICIVLVAVIIAFSCCISASALTSYNFTCSQPQLQGNDCYIEFVTSNGYAILIYVKAFLVPTVDSSSLNISFSARLSNNHIWIRPSPNTYTSDGVRYSISSTGLIFYNTGYFGSTGSTGSADMYESGMSLNYVGSIVSIRSYNCNVSDIGVSNGDFTFVYGNDININNKLDSIISGLRGGNQQIIDNATQNSQQIQQNQDNNTDKVIQNQEENQEEIKNGWQQEESIDSSVTDDYGAKDKELQEATEHGRSQAVSVFNSFGSLFQSDGHLYKGLLSVSAIFTEFMKIDWLSSLFNFSLAIGIFAFVIGTGSSIFKSAHEKYQYKKENSQSRKEMSD